MDDVRDNLDLNFGSPCCAISSHPEPYFDQHTHPPLSFTNSHFEVCFSRGSPELFDAHCNQFDFYFFRGSHPDFYFCRGSHEYYYYVRVAEYGQKGGSDAEWRDGRCLLP